MRIKVLEVQYAAQAPTKMGKDYLNYTPGGAYVCMHAWYKVVKENPSAGLSLSCLSPSHLILKQGS